MVEAWDTWLGYECSGAVRCCETKVAETKTAEALQAQLARIPTRAASPALPVPPPTSMSASVPDADSPMMLLADHENESGEPSMLEQRLSIVRSVRRGDIEGALNELGERFPDILARDGGMI